uniref:ABC transporter G family member 23 n=1 Tax=Lygus hesperus TaxID=30085 RepID=A0A0A9YEH2_LYGHE
MDSGTTAMVQVLGGHKAYGQDAVLNNLNMTVPSGKIYGLLGPSGCGKTVLLNCIIGCRLLDSGLVKLGVTKKAEVGYMPQEIGLFEEFTIKETFVFYGRMFGMDYKAVKARSKCLTSVLDLPDWRSRIGGLSGGEQRRVSLAVALLHEPKLLLLDEPTVGVDPLLSRNIWEFLDQSTKAGVTVIVTTHYVEEARMAHVIGLMREGELLIEDSPGNVMSSQNADTLEEAFLQLSKRHQADVEKRTKDLLKKHDDSKQINILERGQLFSWDRFLAQLVKNFIWMKRNTTIIGLLLLLPAMQSFLFCLSFGHNPTNIKVAVVADELSSGTNLCVDGLKYVTVEDVDNCTIPTPFSCHLLHLLERSTDAVMYSSSDEAKAAVYANRVWAYLHIPRNFSLALTELVIRGIGAQESEDDLDRALEQVVIDVHMDSSNYIMNQLLRMTIIDRFAEFMKDLVKSCGFPEQYGSPPVRFMDPVFGSKDPVFAHSGLPGFLCSFCFFFTLLFTSGSLMMEKLVGLLDRSLVAGMTYFEVVMAHLVIQCALIILQKSIMLVVFYVIFDHPFLGNTALLISLLFAIEFVGVAFGFFITETFSSDRLVTYAVIGATLSVFVLSGIIWPMEGAHAILRETAWAFPVSPAVESYKSITLRGHGLGNFIVLKGFISCFSWILILSLGTLVVFKAKRNFQVL